MKIRDIMNLIESVQLDESFKDAKQAFLKQGIDETEIDQVISQFKQLSSDNKLYGRKKDIGAWMSAPFSDLKDYVKQQSNVVSKRQKVKDQKKDRIIAHKDSDVTIVIPLSKDASIFYGKNTKWCTSATESENYFKKYFFSDGITLFYVITKETKVAVSIYPDGETYEIFDELDKKIDAVDMKQLVGVSIDKIKELYEENKPTTGKVRKEYLQSKFNTEEKQLTAVSKNGDNIIQIIEVGLKPSERVQLAAVSNSLYAMSSILDAGIKPSEQVQLAAVSFSASSINYIISAGIKPSEQVQLATVNNDGMMLLYLIMRGLNPSEEVLVAAVTNNSYALNHIISAGIEPSDAVKKAAGL